MVLSPIKKWQYRGRSKQCMKIKSNWAIHFVLSFWENRFRTSFGVSGLVEDHYFDDHCWRCWMRKNHFYKVFYVLLRSQGLKDGWPGEELSVWCWFDDFRVICLTCKKDFLGERTVTENKRQLSLSWFHETTMLKLEILENIEIIWFHCNTGLKGSQNCKRKRNNSALLAKGTKWLFKEGV